MIMNKILKMRTKKIKIYNNNRRKKQNQNRTNLKNRKHQEFPQKGRISTLNLEMLTKLKIIKQ